MNDFNSSNIYPSDFESKISFDSVRRSITELCQSRQGRSYVEEMAFSADFDLVGKLLRQTLEMKSLIESEADLPSDSTHDIVAYLAEVKSEGSYMAADRLYKLLITLRSMESVRRYFCNGAGDDGKSRFPMLEECFSSLMTFPVIIETIDRVVNKFGEIKDTASPRLAELRRDAARASASMSSVMRRVVDRVSAEGFIDKDTAPTMRDGRLCIPVAAMMKRKINGIVHDQSATGKTFFIEPAELVEAGNRLKEIELEIRREEIVILTEVASSFRPYIGEMCESAKVLGFYDFIRAKAKYAIEVGGEMPVLEKKLEIDWFHAVHPVLLQTLRRQGREVVPLNLHLDSRQRILIISGPNAGGKSVCLKTAGIIQYMLQCGVLPTMHGNSHASVFNKIFIDIGDEQSLENDLSTYSSHLRNMKHFLQYADKNTLFLADEMGMGTEPQIGGALAQSILLELNSKHCFGIVTTHYHNLKTLADTEEGFINGAMLYDRQHLQPLFQLSVGSPGSSFALEIAAKTGLPRSVIDKAKELVGSDYVQMDKYLLDIARDRRYWANKRLSVKEKENKLDRLLSTYEDNADNLRSQRSAILRQAKEEAKEIMATANAKIENAILEIRKAEAEKARTKQIRADLETYKQSLDAEDKNSLPEALKPLKHKSNASRQPKKKAEPTQKRELVAGDYVQMDGGGVTGRILSVEGNKAEVAFGSLRTIAPLSKLKFAKGPKQSASDNRMGISASTYSDSRERQLKFSTELDVRGMRGDEALQALIYFLDDALQFSASRVRILHGTGHGILRDLIRKQLKTTPGVKAFADEDVRFGGAGITVVDLD